MKSTFGLVLVAIATTATIVHAGNPAAAHTLRRELAEDKSCKLACLPSMLAVIHKPMFDEDGNVYPDKCTMCKEKQKSRDSVVGGTTGEDSTDKSCNFICPESVLAVVRPPVVDDNGNVYESECEMKRAKCKEKQKAANGGKKSREGDDSDSTVGDSTDQSDTFCPQLCLDVFDPVTDENGKTYSNECYMKRAKCKGKKKDVVDILEEYERIYGKPFGAPRKSNVDDDATDK